MLGWIKLLAGNLSRNSSEDPDEFRLSLVEHLEELRSRIVRSAVVIVLLWCVIGGLNWDGLLVKQLINQFQALVPKNIPIKFVWPHVTSAFMFHMKLSFQMAVVVAAPFLVLQVWGFVAPGLKTNEKKPVQMVAPFSIVLFAMGVYFCWMILPAAFSWFIGYVPDYGPVELLQQVDLLAGFTFMMLLAFGLGFQLPLLTWILSKLGVVTPSLIRRSWRQLSVGIFVLSAILTPSNDIFSMLMMAVPLTLMFAITALIILWNAKSAPRDPLLDDLD